MFSQHRGPLSAKDRFHSGARAVSLLFIPLYFKPPSLSSLFFLLSHYIFPPQFLSLCFPASSSEDLPQTQNACTYQIIYLFASHLHEGMDWINEVKV